MLGASVTALGPLLPGRMLLGTPAWAAPTPACDDATEAQTEGPFYTPDSPRKQDFRADGPGEPVTLAGRVVDTSCRPVPDAVIDLWHADDAGRYDNGGYRFRGHQRTDREGGYRFETIRPGVYGSRTRHYHLKIAPPNRPVLTTQLYFPGEPRNAEDGLFREDLVLRTEQSGTIAVARFEFVVPPA